MRRRSFLSRLSAGGASIAMAGNSVGAQPGQVTIVVPEDGGTPRDPGRIVRLGDREFRVLASVEEGKGLLTHAVSRVDLVVRNSGEETEATFHLDLSEDGKRTNFDSRPEGGMPTRDYVYLQAPGQPWRRVDGTTSGWVATVRARVAPGDTRLGLSPWYTYTDYVAFVGALPDHPHLKKAAIGRSDGGREHWELTITDPSVPAEEKQRIFWHAREHAYETFSSFAVEGLISFLLSSAAAEFRRSFAISIHPMTNVDGVAGGYEYRGGYDYPQPRGTATGRLTFETVDRLRPHFAVAWHNWIAPRDVDVVFFTDSEGGQPSRRGWDEFTRRFPSPRAVGHRWGSEDNPNEKNWHGRKLGEGNVHQYAMKRYGTRVWGWEMPWWNRGDEGDPAETARRTGAHFGRAFLETLLALEKPAPAAKEPSAVEARCRETHEFELSGRCHVDNPFRDATLVGEFTSPSGKRVSLEGFHAGGDRWKLRFVPEEEGEWRYRLRGEGVALFAEGRLLAKAPRERGFIRIHPGNPYAFAYADGTPFFPMGDTCYGLHDDSPVTPELRRQYLDTRRGQRFNFVRMSMGHSARRASLDGRFWGWGGTPERPDLDRLNPRFFDSLEEVLLEMQARGMNAELLLFNYYRRPFTDPLQWTGSRERLWLRYAIARFASFRNIFLWTLANEYETHPDGRYRLDRPGDVEWAKRMGRLVRQLDPYRRPFTVHPVISSSAKGASPRDGFEGPWRIGGFFGEADGVDVLSQQTSIAYQSKWDEKLNCWTGDAAGVEKSIAADRVYRKPVLNTENGYEYLAGYPTNKRQVYHTDTVRRASWRIVTAGGYFAAGFISTLAHSDAWDRIEPGSRHPFLVRDSGAAGQLAALYDFFTALPFWRMEPGPGVVRAGNGLCLWAAGEVAAVYLPHGGAVQLEPGPPSEEWTARWFDPRRGRFHGEAFAVRGRQELRAPDAEDWAVLVKRRP